MMLAGDDACRRHLPLIDDDYTFSKLSLGQLSFSLGAEIPFFVSVNFSVYDRFFVNFGKVALFSKSIEILSKMDQKFPGKKFGNF